MTQIATRNWNEIKQEGRRSVPEGLWLRCPSCAQMIYRRQMESNMYVCPECEHHFRISARQRIEQLADPDTFVPMFTGLRAKDPLNFTDLKAYPERIKREQIKTGENEGCQAGKCFIKGRPTMIACLDLTFMMGSMGSVAGEMITRTIELTDPTTGGVTASFAMLGDFNIAEPKALIGFAGPRVIKQTIRQDLPEGFQRSEFLRERGMIDRVVHRHELRSELARLIDYAGK